MVHNRIGGRPWPAEGTAPLTCHGDDILAAPFHMTAAEQDAQHLRHQGLGQRCRRHDQLGLSLA